SDSVEIHHARSIVLAVFRQWRLGPGAAGRRPGDPVAGPGLPAHRPAPGPACGPRRAFAQAPAPRLGDHVLHRVPWPARAVDPADHLLRLPDRRADAAGGPGL